MYRNDNEKLQSLRSDKPVIALICSGLSDLGADIWMGAQKAAKDRGAKIIAYIGDAMHSRDIDARPSANISFEVPHESVLDGAVVYTGSVGQYSTEEQIMELIRSYKNLPLVSLAHELPSISSVVVDNYNGIYDMVHHLYNNNGRKTIAFIKGPDGHPEAEERLKAYKDGLESCGLSFDPQLVAPGDFSSYAGVDGVAQFLDEYKKSPDAIVCVDDDTALGVVEALRARNISIPETIAVTGFDDIEEAAALDPPLSTVKQPLEKTGYTAVEALMDLLENKAVAPKINVPTELVLRTSCGCSGILKNSQEAKLQKKTSLQEHLNELTAKVESKVVSDQKILKRSTVQDLMESLDEDVREESQSLFIKELAKTIRKMEENQKDVALLHGTISAIRHQAINHLPDEAIGKAEDIFQQARVMIHQASNRRELINRLDVQHEFSQLSRAVQDLNSASNREQLWNFFDNNLESLGIHSCYVFMYSNPHSPLEGGKNIYSQCQGKRLETLRSIPVRQVLPPEIFRQEEGHSFAFEPLYFGEEQLGYAFFQMEPERGETCDTLSWQISSVLKRIILMENKEEEDQILRERNQQITSLVSPMLDSIGDINSLSQEKSSVMEELRSLIQKNSKEMEQIQRTTQQIASDTKRMLEIVKVIDDIAESVNVLAINASIESSHAGEYGRGFAVIAKEIRRLSDSTSENSNSISQLLQQSAENVVHFTKSSDQNRDSFLMIEQRIQEFLEFFSDLTQKMGSLSRSSSDILDMMDRE